MVHLKIRHKIFFIIIFASTLISFIAVASIWTLGHLDYHLEKVVDRAARKVSLSHRLRNQLLKMHNIEKNLIVSLSIDEMQKLQHQFIEISSVFEKLLVDLQHLAEKTNFEKLRRIQNSYQNYIEIFNEIARLTLENSNQEAKRLMRQQINPKFQTIDQLTRTIRLHVQTILLGDLINTPFMRLKPEVQMRLLEQISGVESGVLKAIRTTQQAILALDHQEILQHSQQAEAFLKSIDNQLDQIEKLLPANQEIAALHQHVNEYAILQQTLLELTQKNSNQKAFLLSSQQARQEVERIDEILKEVANYHEKGMQRTSEETGDIYRFIRNVLILLSILSVSILILVGFLTLKGITQRISMLVQGARIIAGGNYSFIIEDPSADELQQVSEALNQMVSAFRGLKSDLEQSNQYKSQFLANVSHELRTPLNSLIILSQTLAENKENNLSHDQLECIDNIYNSGTELLSMINDLLDLAQIEAGRMTLYLDYVRPDELVNYVIKTFDPLIRQKGIELMTKQAADLPPHLYTDIQKVEQIIKNLLSNAIKFTERGKISLYIYRPSAEELQKKILLQSQSWVAISISDTGIGISPSDQNLIFQEFHQVDGSIRRKYGGTGLGLSISKQFAHILGGFITLNSQINQGSTFILYLPESLDQEKQKKLSKEHEIDIDNSQPSKKGTSQPDLISETLPRKDVLSIYPQLAESRVLIVDDDMRSTFALMKRLKEKQVQVFVETNGQDCIAALEADPDGFDLILMDLLMPKLDGYETIRVIRQKLALGLPIIVLTANLTGGVDEEVLAIGANAFFGKPVDIDKLFVKMGYLLQKVKGNAPLDEEKISV
ncbi:MAG: response regulator [SAR324 cluster bacterium]|nr:response regulator [SAR324 cluster bacterium]